MGDRSSTILVSAAAVFAAALAAGSAAAHHAFAAEFDANRPIRLEGTIARLELINPHSWIHLDVTNDDGSVTRWMVEGGPPNLLFRRGFTEDSLPVGTEIIVEGFQARDGSARANGRNVTFADGSSPFAGDFSANPTR
jgi:prepilin-type processing-associated H-X9-DG protein